MASSLPGAHRRFTASTACAAGAPPACEPFPPRTSTCALCHLCCADGLAKTCSAMLPETNGHLQEGRSALHSILENHSLKGKRFCVGKHPKKTKNHFLVTNLG